MFVLTFNDVISIALLAIMVLLLGLFGIALLFGRWKDKRAARKNERLPRMVKPTDLNDGLTIGIYTEEQRKEIDDLLKKNGEEIEELSKKWEDYSTEDLGGDGDAR